MYDDRKGPVPGDLIEWVYNSSNVVVSEDEIFWSSTMNQFVPIGCPALLISYTGDKCSWLSKKGLFSGECNLYWVIPRKLFMRVSQ